MTCKYGMNLYLVKWTSFSAEGLLQNSSRVKSTNNPKGSSITSGCKARLKKQ